jgi:hypothetical protein
LTLRGETRLALGALALTVAAFVAGCAWLRVPLVDDAAISIAYGRSLFLGHGLRLTASSQPVEAFSNPLWTVLLGLSVPLRLDPIALASRLGVALAALSLVAAAAWGPCDREDLSLRLDDVVAALVPCAVTAFSYWAGAGLETGLLSLLLSLSGALWLRERRTGRGVGSAVTLGLVCLTRPEGALYALAAVALSQAQRPSRWVPPSRRWGAVLAAIAGAWIALRWSLFASLVANTYYAKRDADFGAWSYLSSFARAHLPLLIALGAALPLGLAAHRRRSALALAWIVAGVSFVVRFRGDWMPEWRFLAPLAPCMGALAAAGVSALRQRHGGRTTAAIVAALLTVAIAGAWTRAWRLRGTQEVSYTGVYKDARVLGRYLRSLGLRHPLIALPDVGGLALAMPEAEVMDPAMLADWSLARHARSRALQEDYLRHEGPPAVLDAHGPSAWLLRLPRLMGAYVPLASVAPELHLGDGVYVLRGLTATDDPRCPGGRARVAAMTVVQLEGAVEEREGAGDPVTALRLWRCAWSDRDDAHLPPRAWRAEASREAMADSDRSEAAGRWEAALRYASLATVLGGQDAHDRRRTEALRERAIGR